MSSISSMTSIPAPDSVTAPFASTGSAPGSRSVLRTTNSWTSSGPVFVTWKVTSPAATDVDAGTTAHSWRETCTVPVPAAAVGLGLTGAGLGLGWPAVQAAIANATVDTAAMVGHL